MRRPKILLGITGSVAATLAPKLVQALQDIGDLQVVATESALHFWTPSGAGHRCWRDSDEWPSGGHRRGNEMPHIALGDWADLLVVAPLTANTLAKMAHGLADNLLTSLYLAWPRRPVILAPAMNTRMLESVQVQSHLAVVRARPGHIVVDPVEKRLACGTTGFGAMADIGAVVEAVRLCLLAA